MHSLKPHHLLICYYLYRPRKDHLLTPWCRVLEKLTGLQLVKKFPAFHGTRRSITALTSVRHLSLSWASPIQSIYPHPTSWRSILILSTHLCLGLPNGLLPTSFPSKTLYTPPSPHPYAPHVWNINSHSKYSFYFRYQLEQWILSAIAKINQWYAAFLKLAILVHSQ